MLAEERFTLILEQLNGRRTVTVQQLCEALHTSESTIRRDLTELDRLGKLNKVHGGATLPDNRFQAEEPTMQAKETLAVPPCRTAVFWPTSPPWRPRRRWPWPRSAASRRRRPG